jgi:hypothetical protein
MTGLLVLQALLFAAATAAPPPAVHLFDDRGQIIGEPLRASSESTIAAGLPQGFVEHVTLAPQTTELQITVGSSSAGSAQIP